jgi:hypothetical protein
VPRHGWLAAHLSLETAHCCGWGSLYDALAAGHVSVTAVEDLLATHPLPDGTDWRADLRGGRQRLGALRRRDEPRARPLLPPSRHSAGQPIVAGWAYQWIAQHSLACDSWTAPLSVRRLDPHDNPNRVAAEQIVAVCRRRDPGDDALPIFVCDAGYDPVQLAQAVDQTRVALLVRLRAGRCFYADPAPEEQPATGRPRRHGHKFACADPATWLPPSDDYRVADAQSGTLRVRAWADLHPKPQEHGTRGTCVRRVRWCAAR